MFASSTRFKVVPPLAPKIDSDLRWERSKNSDTTTQKRSSKRDENLGEGGGGKGGGVNRIQDLSFPFASLLRPPWRGDICTVQAGGRRMDKNEGTTREWADRRGAETSSRPFRHQKAAGKGGENDARRVEEPPSLLFDHPGKGDGWKGLEG